MKVPVLGIRNNGGLNMKNTNGIDYKMTQRMFDSILDTRTEEEKKQNPYSYVMDVLNAEYGLRGTVKHISIFDI